jgi:hypothetical protein
MSTATALQARKPARTTVRKTARATSPRTHDVRLESRKGMVRRIVSPPFYLADRPIQVVTEWWTEKPDPQATEDVENPGLWIMQRAYCPLVREVYPPMDPPAVPVVVKLEIRDELE